MLHWLLTVRVCSVTIDAQTATTWIAFDARQKVKVRFMTMYAWWTWNVQWSLDMILRRSVIFLKQSTWVWWFLLRSCCTSPSHSSDATSPLVWNHSAAWGCRFSAGCWNKASVPRPSQQVTYSHLNLIPSSWVFLMLFRATTLFFFISYRLPPSPHQKRFQI